MSMFVVLVVVFSVVLLVRRRRREARTFGRLAESFDRPQVSRTAGEAPRWPSLPGRR